MIRKEPLKIKMEDLKMSKNYLDESCLKCAFHNAGASPLYCDFTLDPTVSPVRCSILKENVKKIKFREKLI